MLRLQLFVERLGVDGLRAELLFGVTALFAQDGEYLTVRVFMRRFGSRISRQSW